MITFLCIIFFHTFHQNINFLLIQCIYLNKQGFQIYETLKHIILMSTVVLG